MLLKRGEGVGVFKQGEIQRDQALFVSLLFEFILDEPSKRLLLGILALQGWIGDGGGAFGSEDFQGSADGLQAVGYPEKFVYVFFKGEFLQRIAAL